VTKDPHIDLRILEGLVGENFSAAARAAIRRRLRSIQVWPSEPWHGEADFFLKQPCSRSAEVGVSSCDVEELSKLSASSAIRASAPLPHFRSRVPRTWAIFSRIFREIARWACLDLGNVVL